ncbi:MAG: LacI family DNA-binding transcriptional regulator [Nocardiopsaceae bacterium]|nr:LacI family DNA-binding transcriptional regulator [Nocardiopsaceae bacterium]
MTGTEEAGQDPVGTPSPPRPLQPRPPHPQSPHSQPPQPRPRSQSVRIKDVAARASVSVATVSRVLNGDPNVAAGLRDQVRAAVAELGYRPNRLARNLRRRHMEALGVVVPDIENPHFAEVVRVIETFAIRHGYRVLVCNTDEDADRQEACLRMLADERASGIVLSPSDPDGSIDQLVSLGIPVVTIDRALKHATTDLIVADNASSVRLATRRLIDAGHQRIAFVGGRSEVETGSERQEGYVAAVEGAGLNPIMVNGGFRRDPATQAVAGLLRQSAWPSALVVANNLMALGALKAIRDRGLRVPDDIAIIAVDNPDWSELLDPPLSVLAQPIRAMASEAAELLIRRIGGEDFPPVHSVHQLELIIRRSCGTAAMAADPGGDP